MGVGAVRHGAAVFTVSLGVVKVIETKMMHFASIIAKANI